MAIYSGEPAALLLSEPILCVTVQQSVTYQGVQDRYSHQVSTPLIVEYIPVVTQNVAKYRTRMFDPTVSSRLK